MIQITFTEEAIAQLHYERYHHPHPRVQQRMEALLWPLTGGAHRAGNGLLTGRNRGHRDDVITVGCVPHAQQESDREGGKKGTSHAGK